MYLEFHLVQDQSSFRVLSRALGIQFPPPPLRSTSFNSLGNSTPSSLSPSNLIFQVIKLFSLEKLGSLQRRENEIGIPGTSNYEEE